MATTPPLFPNKTGRARYQLSRVNDRWRQGTLKKTQANYAFDRITTLKLTFMHVGQETFKKKKKKKNFRTFSDKFFAAAATKDYRRMSREPTFAGNLNKTTSRK